MAKMTAIKKAWQRADRLGRQGVVNAALTRYLEDIKIINDSGMTRKQKSEAKTAIAKRFLASKTSTVTGIKEAWKQGLKSGRIKGLASKITDVREQARYLDAGKETRRYLEARALGVSSDQIRYSVDMLDAAGLPAYEKKVKFYNILSKLNEYIYMNENVAPDDVTRLIHQVASRYDNYNGGLYD